MFASGVVKLLSQCPTWWGLTALHHHFETQPLPHVGAFYAHMVPDVLKKYGVVGTYVVEIFLPLLFYSPFREHRITASVANILFMGSIIGSGNYNFFNFLTIILDMVVLDDDFLLSVTPNFVWKMLAIPIPAHLEYERKKHETDLGSNASSLFQKIRTLMSFVSLLVLLYFLFALLFPFSLVVEGRLPFKYKDMIKLLHDPSLVMIVLVWFSGYSIFSFFFGFQRWLHHNRN